MKHLEFQEIGTPRRTRVFRVISQHDNSLLGFVQYHTAWRQYVYQTPENERFVLWSVDCLAELLDFVKGLNWEHKLKTTPKRLRSTLTNPQG